MSKLELSFLGLFSARLDGAPVTSFESNKVRALLAYLVVEAGRPHAREALATLLWPDWPDSSARSNLRYALANLRKTIHDQQAEPPFLLISRDAIQFNPASDYCSDASEIAALASSTGGVDDFERLERVVALYKGEFLEGFSIGDAAPFEDWARLKREQLHRAYLQGLHRLAAFLERGGDLERALPYAWRLVEVEPLDESAHRQLMRLLALSGRGAEALAQYESCRDVLQQELGAAPSAETTGLYEQIRLGEMEAPAPSIIEGTVSKLPDFLQAAEIEKPVFVAREAEMERLDAILISVLGGSGQVVFIIGDAGRGKTALLREYAYRASEAVPSLLAVSGGCNPYSGVSDPYLPLRSALRMLMGNVDLARSSGMFTQAHLQRSWQAAPQAFQALLSYGSFLVDTFIPGGELLSQAKEMGIVQHELQQFVEQAANKSTQLAQQHLFEQYCGVLRTLSRDHPLLILLDDMQWSDAATAALLYHLATRLEGSRILVLCSYRPEEVVQVDGELRHPLEKALVEIKRRYGDVWLDLAESDERQGRCFMDGFLDSEPNRLGQEFRQQLFQLTQGHALFTVELLRAMQARGDLLKDADGNWVAGPEMDMGRLPARVDAVIAERVERLNENIRQTLSIASVEGEEFTAQVAARVKGVDERQMQHELSQELGKRHRLVREQGELQTHRHVLTRYRFAHAMYQQYLYNGLSSAERRLLHRATAQALEELYAGDEAEIAPQLAFHWGQAKDASKTRGYLILTGQGAMTAYANTVAEGYFRQALELDPTGAQRAALLGGLGEALRRQARREEAAPMLREGIVLYHHIGDLDGIANLYRCLSLVLWQDNKLEAWNACQEGLERLVEAPDSPGLACLLSEAGRTAHLMENVSAEDLCRRAIGMAERLGILEAQAEATITLAMILDNVYGKYTESIQMLEQMIRFCETNNLWRSAMRAHSNLGVMQYAYDIDIHSVYQHTFQGAKLSMQIGDIDSMFWCLDLAAEASCFLGNLTSVEHMLTGFLQPSSAPADRIGLFLEDISNGLLFYRGDWVQASEYHSTNLSTYRNQQDIEGIATANYKMALDHVELHSLTGLGNLSEAEAALLENLEHRQWIYLTQSLLVKVYSLQNRFTEAHALLVKLFKATPIYRLMAKSSHAMAERRWDQAALVTLSLINLLQTISRRWEWARTLIDLGEIYSHRGRPGDLERAREAYQQSLEMFSEMEAIGYIQVLEERLQSLPMVD